MPRFACLYLLPCLVLTFAAPAYAQKGKPTPPADVAADAVFRDFDGDLVGLGDLLRSDGVQSGACWTESSPSRYCGGHNETYPGLGPECSRIAFTAAGDYSFRTRSSRCDPGVTPRRSMVVDLSGFGDGRCTDDVPANDFISKTVVDAATGAEVTRSLDICGPTLVEDVRVDGPGMRTQSSTALVILLSLHGPPLANTTQFILEYTSQVAVSGDGTTRTVEAGPVQVARLYDVVPGKGGKLVKVLVGTYAAPLTFTAQVLPLP